MTSLLRLLWIASGVVLQLATYLAIGLWRHWQDYQRFRIRAVEFSLPDAPLSRGSTSSKASATSTIASSATAVLTKMTSEMSTEKGRGRSDVARTTTTMTEHLSP